MSEHPLLPSDRYIADLLGLTDDQYRYYLAEVRRRAMSEPRPSVVAEVTTTLATIAVISSILSLGLTIAASFFKPKPQRQSARLQQNQTQGATINNVRRFAPRQGFDSVQDVATIGDVIPLIYACREQIAGQFYGGIRINTPLIWSQITALDKSQLLRALFLIGEGTPTLEIEPSNIAIGNNTLGSYLLGNTENSRFTAYYRPDGGRVTANDRILGTSNDPGSLIPEDVYAVRDQNGIPASNFSHARRPSTQTQFGVYTLIGNGFGFRMNPNMRPGVNAQITVDVIGKKKKAKAQGRVVCEPDYVSLAQREKLKAKFSGRSGLITQVGNTWTYHLSNTTDAETVFTAGIVVAPWTTSYEVSDNPFTTATDAVLNTWLTIGSVVATSTTVSALVTLNTTAVVAGLATEPDGVYIVNYNIFFIRDSKNIYAEHIISITKTTTPSTPPNPPVVTYSYTNSVATVTVPVNERLEIHQERSGDAANAVAGRQKTWDDSLQVGELIKLGSALALCTERTPSNLSFNSDADFEPVVPSKGNAIDVTLEVIRTGSAQTIPLADLVKDALSNPAFYTATNFPQLFRIAIANFSTLRECRIVEVCIKSALGIRISGLCNFRDTLTYQQIDARACYDKEGSVIPPGDYLTVDIFNSGQMNSSEERFSFFRIRYRESGTEAAFTELAPCFGVRGITQQQVFNDFRIVMPAVKRWEFQIEPLSGWEIRSGSATGDLELIDSSLTTERTITTNGVTITFKGLVSEAGPFIPEGLRSALGPEKFLLSSGQRGDNGEIGIGYSDGSSYLDAWGKLAEAFVYEEVRTTAESSPEHEIVNVNEILPNAITPEYTNLALLGFNVRSGPEWQQFGQISVYVLKGLAGGTHLFPEILLDLLTNTRYGKGDQITTELIDLESFALATTWCRERRLFFDGAIVGRTNLRQWAADVAAAHLCLFGESAGKFWLRPAWPGTVANPEPAPIKGIFTAGNILENSFALEFLEPEERQPIQVSVKFREERMSVNLDNPGVFSTEREILVREAEPFGQDTDPIESIDLSDYVTSQAHAIDAAKFIARMRRIPDHAVKFSTTHEGLVASIQPGDYIRVAMDVTHYDELRNGVVTADGGLVSTTPFADGSYNVFAWNGQQATEPELSTLVVSGEGAYATPSNIIFTFVNTSTVVRTYQIERITPADEGSYSIEAVHMPTNERGFLLLAENWGSDTTDSNWIIQA